LPAQKPAPKKAAPKRGRATRVVVEESDDDDEVEDVKLDTPHHSDVKDSH